MNNNSNTSPNNPGVDVGGGRAMGEGGQEGKGEKNNPKGQERAFFNGSPSTTRGEQLERTVRGTWTRELSPEPPP